jgi:hypothetical protein
MLFRRIGKINRLQPNKDREQKRCTRCNEIKTINEFYKRTIYKGKQYYQSHCKKCDHKRTRAWAKANPEKNRTKALRWLHKQKNAAQSEG